MEAKDPRQLSTRNPVTIIPGVGDEPMIEISAAEWDKLAPLFVRRIDGYHKKHVDAASPEEH